MLLDLIDYIDPGSSGDAIKSLRVLVGCKTVCEWEFDRLPELNYLIGADSIYKIEPDVDEDGLLINNRPDDESNRRFIYQCTIDFTDITGEKALLEIRASSYSGSVFQRCFMVPFMEASH